MKDEYTIHEFSQLYGVGPDALRHYEKLGLLKPRRGENGYRLYNLRDVYRLTIIRDLRGLGFSLERIGEYLGGLSVDNSLKLFAEEEALIAVELRRLRAHKRAIRQRQQVLARYAAAQAGVVSIAQVAARSCVQLGTDITRDEEVDFVIKRLHRRHADTVRDLGRQVIGAGMRLADVEKGVFGKYRSVFFILEEGLAHDFLLPEGTYASLLYRGAYSGGRAAGLALLEQVRAMGRAPAGDVLELYHIDNRYTLDESEFVTELQVRVE